MHSSRMHTACGNSHPGGGGVCLSACWDTHTPWVWAWKPSWLWAWRYPPGCGPGDTLGVGLETPLGVGLEIPQAWAWRPHGQTPQLPPGCGPGDPPGDLQGMLVYHLQGMLGYHHPCG